MSQFTRSDRRGCIRSVIIYGGLALVIGLILSLFAIAPNTFLTRAEVEGTVVDTYIKRYNDADYFHIVVRMPDGSEEIFQNHDNVFWLKFNSADVQQQVEIGESYTFTVTGFRWPLFSMFRNIVGVAPLK